MELLCFPPLFGGIGPDPRCRELAVGWVAAPCHGRQLQTRPRGQNGRVRPRLRQARWPMCGSAYGLVSAHCPIEFFFLFPFFNIHRNSYKFPNFIENYSNLIKMQSKFLMDPPEKIYALGLTKSLFMYYCLVDKSKKSNFEEFIYKNLCMFIH
jgi:hypothetical protein